MEKYVFLFRRQQFHYLMKSIALAIGGILLTALSTLGLYLCIKPEMKEGEYHLGSTLAWFLMIIPIVIVYYRRQICHKTNFWFFFGLLAVSFAPALVWIIAKFSLSVILMALVIGVFLFSLSCYWGLRVKSFLKFELIIFIMFVITIILSILEAVYYMFFGGNFYMLGTYSIVAIIFAGINAHDILCFRNKLPANVALCQSEINKSVLDTAVSLYLNFIGMVFIIDFMKVVVKLLAEKPNKKSAST